MAGTAGSKMPRRDKGDEDHDGDKSRAQRERAGHGSPRACRTPGVITGLDPMIRLFANGTDTRVEPAHGSISPGTAELTPTA